MDINNRFSNIFQINKDFIHSDTYKKVDSKFLQKIVDALNKDKKVIISGMDFSGKIDTIRTFLRKTHTLNKMIYFNKRLDIENIIKTGNNLKKYLRDNIMKDTKIIILQNIGEIENIKSLLQDIFETNYRIIIIGNDIQVNGIEEIEIIQKIDGEIIDNLLYGNISYLGKSNNSYVKKLNISTIRDRIFLDNIFELKSVKDIQTYKSTMSFLSQLDSFISIREMYNTFLEYENIAIKTFTDYIEYSIQSKIISQVTLYDIKKEKEISTKNKYFFLDNGIRNSLYHFRQKKSILIKNLIFNKLKYYNFDIFGGRFGNYEFDFYLLGPKNNSLAIHFSEEEQLKKNITKLNKLTTTKKYLIVENKTLLETTKTTYNNLEIIHIEDFIRKDFI